MIKGGYLYIVTNKHNTVLYIGVTSGLVKRMWEHRARLHPASFTARHNLSKLVYFKKFDSIEEAYQEQEMLNAGTRVDQVKLIEEANREWKDLTEALDQQRLLSQMSLF